MSKIEEIKTYEIDIMCENCKGEMTVSVPKGERCVEYVNNHKKYVCGHCGCNVWV